MSSLNNQYNMEENEDWLEDGLDFYTAWERYMAEMQKESEDRPEQETEDLVQERSKLETPNQDISTKIQSPTTPKTPHSKEGLLNMEESNAFSQFLDSLIVKSDDSYGRIDEELQKLNESLGLPRRASDHDYDSFAHGESIDQKARFHHDENSAYSHQGSQYTQPTQQSPHYAHTSEAYQSSHLHPGQFQSNNNTQAYAYNQGNQNPNMFDPHKYRYNNLTQQQSHGHMLNFYNSSVLPHTLQHYPQHIAHQYPSQSPHHLQQQQQQHRISQHVHQETPHQVPQPVPQSVPQPVPHQVHHQVPHQIPHQVPHHIHHQMHVSSPHASVHQHVPQTLPVQLPSHMVPGIVQSPIAMGNHNQSVFMTRTDPHTVSEHPSINSTPMVDARKQRENNSRQKHMNNEKKRRALINGLYHTMCTMLPDEMTNLLPKSTVLQNVYYHMQNLEERNQDLRKKLIENGVSCDDIPEHRLEKVPEAMIEHWAHDDDLEE